MPVLLHSAAAVLVVVLVLIVVLVIVLVLIVVLVLVIVLILISVLVIHGSILRRKYLRSCRYAILPLFSGFILRLKDQADDQTCQHCHE